MARRFHNRRSRLSSRHSEQGYILLMLMLFMALLAIAAGALAPTIAFEVRRDREEEMIHRGVQYSRAIRRYVKKTGRYPVRLEDLENTNNIRFLRKRYKDPITGEDFKLLHIGEVQLTGVAGIAGAAAIGGGTIPGASPLGAGSLNSGPLSSGSPNSGSLNSASASATSMSSGAANGSSPGGASSMVLGGSPGGAGGGTAAVGAADNSGGQDASQGTPASPDSAKADATPPSGGIGSSQLSSTVFGGGPIVGVTSTSKAATIREFNHKNHYNQWQFIYDPTMDRGGLITTPAQPALQVGIPALQQNPVSSGPNSSSFGSGASGPGMSGPGMSGFSSGPQSPPPAQPTQQQQ